MKLCKRVVHPCDLDPLERRHLTRRIWVENSQEHFVLAPDARFSCEKAGSAQQGIDNDGAVQIENKVCFFGYLQHAALTDVKSQFPKKTLVLLLN